MSVEREHVVLEAVWPQGTCYRCLLGRDGVKVEGFPAVGPPLPLRRRAKRLVAIEHPAGTVTLLLDSTPSWWHRLGRRLRRLGARSPTPWPLDDQLLGTSWAAVDAERLYGELERLGYHIRRTNWDSYLRDSEHG
jgi:hypothetical protein